MTAVSTLDQLDWTTCLDQEPGCESPSFRVRSCDSPATLRIFWVCKCASSLSCRRCYELVVLHLDDGLRLGFHEFECDHCGVTVRGETLDDLVSAVDL